MCCSSFSSSSSNVSFRASMYTATLFITLLLTPPNISYPRHRHRQHHGILVVAASDINDRYNNNSNNKDEHQQLQPWQECSIFLAPSWTGGYGVFAGRDFVKDEIVELAPFFLAVHQAPFCRNSALQDYVYGYTRLLDDDDEKINLSVVVWGMTMWYNHHPTAPNVEWWLFGGEPHPTQFFTNPNVQAVGFIARRNIQAGEELWSSYGEDDGGEIWFRDRHITMATASTPEQSRLSPLQLQDYQQAYCSKIYAGMDQWVYQQRLQPMQPPNYAHVVIPTERLIPPSLSSTSSMTSLSSNNYYNNWQHDNNDYQQPDYPWAVAKVPIQKGDRIELAPALVLDRNLVIDTPMAPLVYFWQDLTPELQASVRELRTLGYYVVQYQGPSTDWQRVDHFTSYQDSVILPVAGWIGRVERVGRVNDDDDNAEDSKSGGTTANCYMKIHPATPSLTIPLQQQQQQKAQDPISSGNAGIMLELIASRDIHVGERIRINLPLAGTFKERLALYKEMEISGQIYAPLRSMMEDEEEGEDEDEEGDNASSVDHDFEEDKTRVAANKQNEEINNDNEL